MIVETTMTLFIVTYFIDGYKPKYGILGVFENNYAAQKYKLDASKSLITAGYIGEVFIEKIEPTQLLDPTKYFMEL